MFNPQKFAVPFEELERRCEKCLEAVRNAFLMYSTDPEYNKNEDEVYCSDPDFSLAIDIGATENFMENFIHKAPDFVPNMYVVMNLIQATDLGAKAFGFIDTSDKVVDEHNKILSGTDAIIYCIDAFDKANPSYYIRSKVASLFNNANQSLYHFNELSLFDDLKAARLSMNDLAKLPVTMLLKLTLLLGLPIQTLFDYNFYTACERIVL